MFQAREPLFPGKTCFPLSADSFQTYKSLSDQLNVIFDVIGTPDVAGLEGKYPNPFLIELKCPFVNT